MFPNETYYPNFIKDDYKQNILEILHNGLKDFLVEGREDALTADLYGVNSNEIGEYLKKVNIRSRFRYSIR